MVAFLPAALLAYHAESERLLVPLGRQWNGKSRLNRIDSVARLKMPVNRSLLVRHHYGGGL